MKSRTLKSAAAVLVVLATAALMGPRPDARGTVEEIMLPDDLDAWVADLASGFDDIVPGTEHRLIWNDEPGRKTPWSVVYLHGFSGSSAMAHPFVDSLASALEANAYLPRFSGHGRGPEALGDARLEDWIGDTVTAIRVGERLGERVLLVGLSNGAALALWAAHQPELKSGLGAVVALSPNVRPADPSAGLLLWPWGGRLAELVVGPTRHWEPHSEQHARFTTNGYPTRVLPQMMAGVKLLSVQDPADFGPPLLMVQSEFDTVVSVEKAREFYERIPTHKQLVEVGRVGDPNNHVIVGDALSPDHTMPTVQYILSFLDQATDP